MDQERLTSVMRLVDALREGMISVQAFEAAAALRDLLMFARERKNHIEILRQSTTLTGFVIQNRGCVCNVPGHRCGTNLMLADVAKIEEHLS